MNLRRCVTVTVNARMLYIVALRKAGQVISNYLKTNNYKSNDHIDQNSRLCNVGVVI